MGVTVWFAAFRCTRLQLGEATQTLRQMGNYLGQSMTLKLTGEQCNQNKLPSTLLLDLLVPPQTAHDGNTQSCVTELMGHLDFGLMTGLHEALQTNCR